MEWKDHLIRSEFELGRNYVHIMDERAKEMKIQQEEWKKQRGFKN